MIISFIFRIRFKLSLCHFFNITTGFKRRISSNCNTCITIINTERYMSFNFFIIPISFKKRFLSLFGYDFSGKNYLTTHDYLVCRKRTEFLFFIIV
eukprot:UN03048